MSQQIPYNLIYGHGGAGIGMQGALSPAKRPLDHGGMKEHSRSSEKRAKYDGRVSNEDGMTNQLQQKVKELEGSLAEMIKEKNGYKRDAKFQEERVHRRTGQLNRVIRQMKKNGLPVDTELDSFCTKWAASKYGPAKEDYMGTPGAIVTPRGTPRSGNQVRTPRTDRTPAPSKLLDDDAFNDMRRQISNLKEKNAHLSSKLEHLEEEKGDWTDSDARVKHLTAELDAQQKAKTKLKAEVIDLKEKAGNWKKQHDKSVEKQEQTEKINRSLGNSVIDLRKQEKVLKQNLADAKTAENEMKQKLDTAKQYENALKEMLYEASATETNFKQKLNDAKTFEDDLKQELNNANATEANLKQKLRDANAIEKDLKQKLNDTNGIEKDLRQKLEDANTMETNLKRDVQHRKKLIKRLYSRSQQLNGLVSDMQREQKDLRSSVQQCMDDVLAAQVHDLLGFKERLSNFKTDRPESTLSACVESTTRSEVVEDDLEVVYTKFAQPAASSSRAAAASMPQPQIKDSKQLLREHIKLQQDLEICKEEKAGQEKVFEAAKRKWISTETHLNKTVVEHLLKEQSFELKLPDAWAADKMTTSLLNTTKQQQLKLLESELKIMNLEKELAKRPETDRTSS